MGDAIVVLNAGSSSLKFSVYTVEGDAALRLAADGQIEGIGTAPRFVARGAAEEVLATERWPEDAAFDHERAFRVLGDWLRGFLGAGRVLGVGHRVVHGGPQFGAPVLVDDAVLRQLDAPAWSPSSWGSFLDGPHFELSRACRHDRLDQDGAGGGGDRGRNLRDHRRLVEPRA